MTETELGEYLASQQRDREFLHRQWLTGSLISDYYQMDTKVGMSFTVGVKQRWVGSSIIVGSLYPNSVVGTGSWGANYVGWAGGSWGFVASGTG